jgi:hypothetical protein
VHEANSFHSLAVSTFPSAIMNSVPTLRDTLRFQPGLPESILSDRPVSDLLSPRASKQAKVKRSKSPTYLRNTKTGERRVRRTPEEVDDICDEKARRKSLIVSRLASETGDSIELGKDSIGNDTQTTVATANDSFTSGVSLKERRSRSLSIRGNRTSVSALVSPKSAKTTSKKKSSSSAGRKIKPSRHGSSLSTIQPIDDESCKTEPRSRKEEKKDKKKKKKLKRSKSTGNVDLSAKSVSIQSEQLKRASSMVITSDVESLRSPQGHRMDRKRGDKKNVVKRSGSYSTSSTLSSGSNDEYASMLVHWKSEAQLKEDDSFSSSRSKLRSTVDENGKIRRVRTPSRSRLVDDDSQSQISSKSRSSERSRRSNVSSKVSRGKSESKKGKVLKDRHDDESSFADDASTHSSSSLTWRDFHKRSKSRTLERSSHLRNDASFTIDPMKTTDLQKEIDSLQEELLAIKEERSAGLEETSRAKKELRERNLELQKMQMERGELRTAIRDRDQLMKQKDCQIAALEKAVESQLDKVDDLEEEIHRAYKEIDHLEMRIADLTEMQDKSSNDSAVPCRSLEQPDKIGNDQVGSEAVVERLLQQNKILQRSLDKQAEDADSIILAKDQEIKDLKTQLRQLTSGAVVAQDIDTLYETDNRLLDTAKAEAQVMKSRWEGAQWRNKILEKDIEPRKTTNCALEDDIGHMKAEVMMWKARYENSISNNGGGSSPQAKTAADVCLRRTHDDDDEDDMSASQGSSIASLWSKFRSTNSLRSLNSSLHRSVHSTSSRQETVNKATFQ